MCYPYGLWDQVISLKFKHVVKFTTSVPFPVWAIHKLIHKSVNIDRALFFLVLGLRIFFQNIKVGRGEKIKIKITKIFIFI